MILGKVVGTVVSNHKNDKLVGKKLLLLEKIDPVSLLGKNDFIIAIDSVGAGVNEIVMYVSGSSARYTKETEGIPTDSTIIAIVDIIETSGTITYQK